MAGACAKLEWIPAHTGGQGLAARPNAEADRLAGLVHDHPLVEFAPTAHEAAITYHGKGLVVQGRATAPLSAYTRKLPAEDVRRDHPQVPLARATAAHHAAPAPVPHPRSE